MGGTAPEQAEPEAIAPGTYILERDIKAMKGERRYWAPFGEPCHCNLFSNPCHCLGEQSSHLIAFQN